MLPHVSNTSQIGITSHTGHRFIADSAQAGRLPRRQAQHPDDSGWIAPHQPL